MGLASNEWAGGTVILENMERLALAEYVDKDNSAGW
jgi:hypothetical protein